MLTANLSARREDWHWTMMDYTGLENTVLERFLFDCTTLMFIYWHVKELHSLFSSTNIIIIRSTRHKWARHVASMTVIKNAKQMFLVKSKLRPVARRKSKLMDNIKTDIEEIQFGMWTRIISLRVQKDRGLLWRC